MLRIICIRTYSCSPSTSTCPPTARTRSSTRKSGSSLSSGSRPSLLLRCRNPYSVVNQVLINYRNQETFWYIICITNYEAQSISPIDLPDLYHDAPKARVLVRRRCAGDPQQARVEAHLQEVISQPVDSITAINSDVQVTSTNTIRGSVQISENRQTYNLNQRCFNLATKQRHA